MMMMMVVVVVVVVLVVVLVVGLVVMVMGGVAGSARCVHVSGKPVSILACSECQRLRYALHFAACREG